MNFIKQAIAELEERAARCTEAAAALRALDVFGEFVPGPKTTIGEPRPAKRPKLQRTAAKPAAKRRSPSGLTDDQVLAVIAEHKGATLAMIRRATKSTDGSVWSRLQRLTRDGVLTCGADKVYGRAVPATGSQVN